MKRTKIIATIGPASKDVETLTAMIKAGMNAARLNFSHGTYASHTELIKNIRSAAEKTGQQIAIIQDLSGPKLRLGEFTDKTLVVGEYVVLGHGGIPTQRHIWEWIKPGQTIFIDDGSVELMATRVNADSVECKTIVGEKIKSHKGLSLPGVKMDLPLLSEKDLADLEFGLKMGVDFVAMSFVKTSFDIAHLRKYIFKYIRKRIPVVAKIETPEALKNITPIIAVSDAIMIARGDLALNINQALVPIVQKNIIKQCLKAGKPVIAATQMLDSMIHNPRPTIDHVDAIMLSGETAFGKYPAQTVAIMAKIINETERTPLDDYHHSERIKRHVDKEYVIAHTLVHVGVHAKINAIVVSDPKLAADLSRFRPGFNIILAVKSEFEARIASLLWGVASVIVKGNIISALKSHGLIAHNERLMDAINSRKEARIELVH